MAVWLGGLHIGRLTIVNFFRYSNFIEINRKLYSNVRKILQIQILLSHLRFDVPVRRYRRAIPAMLFLSHFSLSDKNIDNPVCIDKARNKNRNKSHWTTCCKKNALILHWDFVGIFISQFNVVTNVNFIVFETFSHWRLSPVQLQRVLRALQCVLCFLYAKSGLSITLYTVDM